MHIAKLIRRRFPGGEGKVLHYWCLFLVVAFAGVRPTLA